MVTNSLKNKHVFDANKDMNVGEDWSKRINNEIEDAIKNGYFLQLITDGSLNLILSEKKYIVQLKKVKNILMGVI